MINKVLKFIGIACLPLFTLQAEEIDYSVSFGLELRGFTENSLQPQQTDGLVPSVFVQPEMKWRSDDRRHRFSFVGFGRYDEQDSERTHLDITELYWSYQKGDWTTTVGINKVFWGVTESVHLVDVINQSDLVEDIDQESKLGQPMIHLSNQKDWGKLDFYLLPYFRERTFPGINGRFNFGLAVSEETVYQSNRDQNHTDLAFRYSHYFGDVDFGFHWFDGTNREPRLMINDDFSELLAVYDQMSQFGIDLQYTNESWLWKLESIYRKTDVDDFFATVLGFEYTFYQINDSAADLGLLLEYQYDGRNELSAPTSADNDLFLATRYAFNNSQDSSVLAGVVIDADSQSTFVNIEAETRIGENLNAELRIRSFSNIDVEDIFKIIERDDYVQLGLTWYF